MMASSTEEFFQALALRGTAAVLDSASGSIRFELTRDRGLDQWRVGIDRGQIRVSRDDTPVDCVVRADQTLFDGVVSGQANAMAALLRGALTVEGDPEPLMLIQRLFPGTRSATVAGRRA